ncbi:MAG: DUF86 domain-containing protein [Candidatus ainarchaeum sp.]|nr:DUF86 domain-containing protein [Candidatus ainarchaeum sp.]
MNARIQDKIREIENYLEELSEILPSSFREYSFDLKSKAACERYFEKIVEAIVDLAFLVIREKGLQTPEEDKEAFDILCKAKIIDAPLATRLKEAKGMRNFLAHQYGAIDDKIVFKALKKELRKDAGIFIASIETSF